MWRRLKKLAVVFVVALCAVFAAAQLVRPQRTNPPIDATRTLEAQPGMPAGLVAVIDRSCGDCHSNGTVWARYPRIAPLSWAVVRGVAEGRKALNFSEWGAYSADDRLALLDQSCHDASIGSMPMRPYLLLRPEARLSARDIETICAASRQSAPTQAGIARPLSQKGR